MTRKSLLWLLALAALCASVPAGAGSVALNYATGRKVIRACILNPGLTAPSPNVFYLLDRNEVTVTIAATGRSFVFYPPKPRGWEFENPLAPPGTPKSNPAYWAEALGAMDMPGFENYDVMLLPVKEGGITLNAAAQRDLAAWVDEGGLLWIDRQRDTSSAGQVALFLEPPLAFYATDETRPVSKFAADPSHPLLRGRFILGAGDIERLGRQRPYSANPIGENALDGISSSLGADPLPAVAEVVRAVTRDGLQAPSIAAARMGAGAVVVTACGVAEGIQDWYQGMVTPPGAAPSALELPEWSLPDLKLVYNMIQWTLDWSGPQGAGRRQGRVADLLPGPLTLIWSHLPVGPVAGAPVIDRGVAYVAEQDGTLSLLDVAPPEGRTGGAAEDGLADWSNGAGADEIGRVTVAGAGLVGSPALATVAGAGPVAVVAARSPTDVRSWLYAFPADPDFYAVGAPASAYWSAILNNNSDIKYGVATTGPVAVDNMILVATSDSGNDQLPGRDGYLLLFDASAAVAGETKTPAVAIALARGGQAFSVTSPPAIAYTHAVDDVILTADNAQVAVLTGNGLPRVGTAATGQLRVVSLSLRLPVAGWDHTWWADPNAGDTAANQLVQVFSNGVQIPPHQNNDPNAPLNYARRVQGNFLEIVFSRFALFRRGAYPTGGQPLRISYRDTSGNTRTVNVELQSGYATFLQSHVAENGQSGPAVAGETVLAVGEALNAFPNNSVQGNVTAVGLGVERIAGNLWTFPGDVTGGPNRYDPATPRDYFTEFSFTPAVNNDTIYVAGNYAFNQQQGGLDTGPMAQGPAGALYALNAKASPNLLSVNPSDPKAYDPATAVVSADPTLAGGLPDPVAPVGLSADPNQVVQAGQHGLAVWITTRTSPSDPNYNSPTYAIPQRSGMTVNWTVDFGNGIIRLGPGGFGRYQGKALRVRYFNAGAIPNGGDGVIVQADRLVNWAYHFASFSAGEEVAAARIISPPVAANGTVHIMVRSNQPEAGTSTYRRYLVSLRENPADASAPDRLLNPWAPPTANWLPVGLPVSNDAIMAAPAATANRVIVATRLGVSAVVEGFANAATLVADNERVIEAQGAAQVAWAGLGSREPSPSPAAGTVDPGMPAYDTYADDAYRGFSRPSWARHLEGGRTLVCDTGHDRVVEIEPNGDVAWQYPGVLIAKTEYRSGLATANGGSPVVTGDLSTLWTALVTAGDRFRIDSDGTWYTVRSVDSDAQLTLTTPYGGAGGAGAAYTIAHVQREDTPGEQRLLGPLDAHRYRQRQAATSGLSDPTGEIGPTDSVVITWNATLIADTGHSRVLEVMQPYLNGKYRPWVYAAAQAFNTAGGYGQATVANGSDAVTRSGGSASWLANLLPGDYFRIDSDGRWYRIASVGPGEALRLSQPYAGASGSADFTAQRRLYYSQYAQELVGAKTTYQDPANPSAVKSLGVKISPSYVERLGNPVTAGGNTTRLICAAGNNPLDPSGRDHFISVVDVAVTYQALPLDPRVVAISVIQLHNDPTRTPANGINVFSPRDSVARDFLQVKQAEQIPVAAGNYDTLIVDDAGVKEINNAAWQSNGTGLVFEFAPADYLLEMQALQAQLQTYGTRPPYPALLDEPNDAAREVGYQNVLAYAGDTVTRQAANGQVDFLPAAAWKDRASGAYTIVNAYGDPYQALGQPPIGAAAKSEVFEVDPRLDLAAAYRAGRRIVRWDFDSSKTGQNTAGSGSPLYGFGSWPHFIAPDPSRSLYPWLPGATYGLKQPQGVDRY